MAEHTSSQFSMELENVRSSVLQMGGLVEKQINETLSALVQEEEKTLLEVLEKDREVNDMQLSIDEDCLVIIARRQPAAGDLRLVLAVSRIVIDLERMGDEVKKITRMAARLLNHPSASVNRFHSVINMLTTTRNMLRRALDAFARLDNSAILELTEADLLIDREYQNQLRTLITYMMEDCRTISQSIDVLFIYKAIERIGDHAKNIGEHVVYLAKGVDIRHAAPEEVERIAHE